MAFREVHVIELKEILRRWLGGESFRAIARDGPADRKTVRRYVKAAEGCGLERDGGEEQLTDELIGMVAEEVRPRGPGVRGQTWKLCQEHREFLQAKVDLGLRLTKVRKLLKHSTGEDIPYRTLHRFATEELRFGGKKPTVRVDDCEPGQELQVDFGRMGVVTWEGPGQKRTLWALIFTAVYSRHMFVWLTFRQTFEAVVEGFEEAWQSRPWSKAARFFGKQHKPLVHDCGGSEVAEKTGLFHPASMTARPCVHVSPIKSGSYP